MEMTNFTADASQETLEYHYCLRELAKGKHYQLIVLIVLNIFLSIIAFLGNSLIIAALHKQSSLHPSSKIFLRNLATTNLALGVLVEPLYVRYFVFVLKEQWDICRLVVIIFRITRFILCAVSLLTLTAISVDRLLALLLGLRYRQVVTLKRIYITVSIFWFICTIASTMQFWNHHITLWAGYIIKLLCLATSVFSYGTIFFTLRRHKQVQAQGQQDQNVLPNRARYKKTVNSALWVQLALVLCYLPNAITGILLQVRLSPPVDFAMLFTETFVFLNSSLNPILYCWKIRQVRRAVKEILKRLFCSSS